MIDERWKDKVYEELIQRFPRMTDDEWKRTGKGIFIKSLLVIIESDERSLHNREWAGYITRNED